MMNRGIVMGVACIAAALALTSCGESTTTTPALDEPSSTTTAAPAESDTEVNLAASLVSQCSITAPYQGTIFARVTSETNSAGPCGRGESLSRKEFSELEIREICTLDDPSKVRLNGGIVSYYATTDDLSIRSATAACDA